MVGAGLLDTTSLYGPVFRLLLAGVAMLVVFTTGTLAVGGSNETGRAWGVAVLATTAATVLLASAYPQQAAETVMVAAAISVAFPLGTAAAKRDWKATGLSVGLLAVLLVAIVAGHPKTAVGMAGLASVVGIPVFGFGYYAPAPRTH